MADSQYSIETARPRKRLLFMVPIMMLLIGAITYYIVQDAQEKIVQFQAVNVAEIVVRQAAASRSVYASQVAGKLAKEGTGPHMNSEDNKGFVPIPAQFLKLVGREASATSDNLYRYKPISKWNLEPTQGLTSDFQKWAWAQLERQDQPDPKDPIAWQPAWRFEDIGGVRTLLYLRADPASASGCVDCHNAMEQSPEIAERRRVGAAGPLKAWKLHQLMGAIQVEIPLDKVSVIVASQTRQTLVWILAVVGIGLVFATWFVFSDFSHAQHIFQLSWLVSHDPVTGFYNHRALGSLTRRLIEDAQSRQRQHALCYLRLAGLREIVSAAGTKAGDQLLRQVAENIRKWVRPETNLVRMHGLDFTLLFPNCSAGQALQAAEVLVRSIKMLRLRAGDKTVELGTNIGVAPITPKTANAEEVLKAAEEACVTATAAGVNQIRFG